jgi:hypothetical protein
MLPPTRRLQQRLQEAIILASPAASTFFFNDTYPESVVTTSDFIIARMLLLQFSKEHDEGFSRIEQKRNWNSWIFISLCTVDEQGFINVFSFISLIYLIC